MHKFRYAFSSNLLDTTLQKIFKLAKVGHRSLSMIQLHGDERNQNENWYPLILSSPSQRRCREAGSKSKGYKSPSTFCKIHKI